MKQLPVSERQPALGSAGLDGYAVALLASAIVLLVIAIVPAIVLGHIDSAAGQIVAMGALALLAAALSALSIRASRTQARRALPAAAAVLAVLATGGLGLWVAMLVIRESM